MERREFISPARRSGGRGRSRRGRRSQAAFIGSDLRFRSVETSPAITAFFDELRLAGFIEGQNLSVVPNGFGVHNDRLTEQAVAVVDAMPDAILTGPDNYARIYQQLTRTIPIIAMTEDMVGAGLVASLARPGGNTTGISLLSPELDGKRQDLLIDMVPRRA